MQLGRLMRGVRMGTMEVGTLKFDQKREGITIAKQRAKVLIGRLI